MICNYEVMRLMNRKETTKFLTELLIKDKLSDRKYYAREVTLDYGTNHPKRIDVMEFSPAGVTCVSNIEKGTFSCYEIKSCKEDVYSGNGLNFYGEYNYIVTTMQCYKELMEDIRICKLEKHIEDFMDVNECPYYGIMVAVPDYIDLRDTQATYSEFENPSKLDADIGYKLWTPLKQVMPWRRSRSMNELLFCMLRAKHNQTNSL